MYGLKRLVAVVISTITLFLTFLLAILIGLSALGIILINIWTLVLPIIICAYLWKIKRRLTMLVNAFDTSVSMQQRQDIENTNPDVTEQAETLEADQEI